MLKKHLILLLLCVGSCLPTLADKESTSPKAPPETLCRPDLCPYDEKHVGCFSNKTYGKKCAKDALIINVNGGLKQGILERINVLRNFIASGAGNLPIAARMPTMGWDTNLQRLADLSARQCEDSYIFCANTNKYRYVATTEIKGEMGKHTNLRHVILARFLPEMFLDVMDCKMDSQYRFHAVVQGSCVGHYIPLIEDRGDRMGCAIRVETQDSNMVQKKRRYRSRERRTVNITLICHFSRANVNSLMHYAEGQEPAERCVTGASQMYSYLCSPLEVVDANNIE